MNSEVFEKYKRQIILSYEHEYDFLQEDTFKRVYQENYHKLSSQKDRDDFRDYCFSDEKFRKYYKICYGEERFNKIDALVNERKNNSILEEKDNSETNDDDWDFSEWNNESDSDNENYDDEKIKEEENLKKQKEEQLNKKIENYKKSFSTKYNGIEEFLDINKDLLIDKITSSIRKHSSTDLKEYLREYSLNAKGPEIKSKYDKAMATNICAAFIVEILDGLKKIFDDDETALKHIDKCSRSLNQLSYEKAKLAETLKTEGKEAESSEEDEFDFTSWDDDDTENNTQNRKPKLTEKEKKFEQLKKEILSASDINKALRFTLCNMPKEDWKDFNAYLFKDKNYRDSLHKANLDEKENSTNQRTSNKTDSSFGLSEWDNDESGFEDVDSKEEKINNVKMQLYQYYDNEKYDFLEPTERIDEISDLLQKGSTKKINEIIETLLMMAVPGKDRNSIEKASRSILLFSIIYNTCTNIANVLNKPEINSFINTSLKKYHKTFEGLCGQINIASENLEKKEKTKQNWKKAGRILGTIALSPLIAYAKAAEWSDNYSQRPEVQERKRKEEERKAYEFRPKIMAYCRMCGKYSSYQEMQYSRSAISDLMTVDSGCGSNRHEPELFEVPDGQQISSTIKYFAYCRVCGKDSGRVPGPKVALSNLMSNSNGCGTGKHTPRLTIVK